MNKLLSCFVMTGFLMMSANATTEIVLKDNENIKWSDAPNLPAGAKIAILSGNPQKHDFFIARIKLPSNYKIPVHSHPINEYDTVISGKISFMVDSKSYPKEITLKAGDFIMLAAQQVHSADTKEETIIQVSGVGPWGMIYKK